MTFAKTPEGVAIHDMVSRMRVNANNDIAFVFPISVHDLAASEGNHDALCAARRELLAASDVEDFAARLQFKRDVVAADFSHADTCSDTERIASLGECLSVLDQFLAALSSNTEAA